MEQQNTGIDFMKSLVIGIFVLAIFLFAFAIAGGNLATVGRTATVVSVPNETGAYLNGSGYTVDNAGATGFSGLTITEIWAGGAVVGLDNATITSDIIYNATTTTYADVNITYSFTYDAESAASGIVTNYTTAVTGLGTSIGTWITLGGLVVLISIIAIIIVIINRVDKGQGNL